MLKRIDHVGVVVDDLQEAVRFLNSLGLRHDRDLELPDRLRASFFACGDVKIEVIEIIEPHERAQRLGAAKARVEHIAIEVDDLGATLGDMERLGIKTQTPTPLKVGSSLNHWTVADTCDGVVYQLIQRL